MGNDLALFGIFVGFSGAVDGPLMTATMALRACTRRFILFSFLSFVGGVAAILPVLLHRLPKIADDVSDRES